MKTYSYETTTNVPAADLYAAITDINRWSEWGGDLDWARHEGEVAPGARFRLKPQGGPEVKMEIVEARPDGAFADVAHLPLAKMHTQHVFEEWAGATHISITITVSGLLAFLWDRVVARKQAAEFAEHTRRFIAFAQTSHAGARP